jgi:lipoate-protein ligase A
MKKVDYKIPGGKMLKIKVNLLGKKIETITILGDFFLHPESTIEAIEESIVGCDVDVDQLSSKIQKVLDQTGAVLMGASALDIAKAIERATNT